METVYEDQSDQNFEFRPSTKLQYAEPDNQRTGYETPTTPIDDETPIETATTTPLDTPPRTPVQRYVHVECIQTRLVIYMYMLNVGSHDAKDSVLFGMCRNLYYDLDEDGGIVSNAKGKRVTSSHA